MGGATLMAMPYERLSIQREDLDAAAQAGLITPGQAEALWARWLGEVSTGATGSAPAPSESPVASSGPRFGFVNVLYYFGGMVAISAMSLFMSIGWGAFGPYGLAFISAGYLALALWLSAWLKRRGLLVPAGILGTLAVALVPLLVWCLQHIAGLWPEGAPSSGSEKFSDYHRFIDWRWLTLEFSTLAAGVVMLWRMRLPFMVMPIAVTLWYMSMDVANMLAQAHGFDWKLSRDVSLVFGLGTCALAAWVDIRTRRAQGEWAQDFAFWLYLFGAIMFWGGLSLRDSSSELGKLAYALLNVGLILGGAAIGRRVFTVLGALGVAGYLGYLSYKVFKDSLMFPFALTLLGLAVVALGIWWQRNEGRINARLGRFVPEGLRPRG